MEWTNKNRGEHYVPVYRRNPMKDELAVSLKGIFVLCLAVGLLLAAGKPAQAAETIKIGFVISITGPYGFIGTPQKEVIEAAVADVNKKGGINGRQLEA